MADRVHAIARPPLDPGGHGGGVLSAAGIPVHPAPLPAPARGWFTGAPTATATATAVAPVLLGRAGNLGARRPHRPQDLHQARQAVAASTGTDHRRWHLMRQVHGAAVGVIEAATPVGAEFDGVDALVTRVSDRPLGVLAADCVPVLLAGPGAVGAIHAGRAGVAADVVGATLQVLDGLGVPSTTLTAVIGPAIGGCCYEVPPSMRDAVAAVAADAAATTTWGTPALDLPAAVTHRLSTAGVVVRRVGGCTACQPGWFSHRRDPAAGRHLGLVVRETQPEERS